eukprot:153384_1
MKLKNRIMLIGDYYGKDIEIYDGINKQWNISKMNSCLYIRLGGFHCLTNNERYLIVNNTDANICIMDLNEKKVMYTDIKCPFGAYYRGIIVNDVTRQELIVCGFIRLCWNKYKMKEWIFPPICIIKLIQSRCCDEYLHIVQSETRYSYY